MRRSVIAVSLVCIALIGAACGNDNKKASKTTSSGAQSREVGIDLPPGDYPSSALAYFPSEVTVRPGDTVNFESYFTGEPHSVTLGKLVDVGLTAAKAAGENAEPPAAYKVLPVMLPQGPGDANQVAVNPCFLAEGGTIPADATKACPKTAQPAFNGRQAYYNSGFLPDGKKFSVTLAADTAPGSYQFYCNLHELAMTGTIVVKPKGSTIPSSADVDAAGKAKRDGLLAKLAGARQAAQAPTKPFPGVTNLAGFGLESDPAELNEFYPASISAKVGEKVAWTVVGPHTVTFNPPADVKQGDILQVDPTGNYHLYGKALAPAGGPGAPPETPSTGPPPTGPPKIKTTVDGGKFDGTSFRSSGFIFGMPPNLTAYSLTFTKAGTFTYLCVIHPKMGGVVTVT